MFGSEILEVAIGVIFTFLVASLVASGVREIIESVLRTRAIQLERGIRLLLDDPSGTGVTKALFDHPLIYGLFEGDYQPHALTGFILGRKRRAATGALTERVPVRSNLPAYIPSRNFALALLDLVGGSGANAGPLSLESLRANVLTLPSGRIRQALISALGEAKNDVDRVRASVESWYDSNMDRVSAWYKRETQWILLGLGLVLAIGLNIDAVHVARTLAHSNAVRETLVASAQKLQTEAKAADQAGLSEEQRLGLLQDLSDVIGWRVLLAEADAAEQTVPPPARHGHAIAVLLAMVYGLPGWLMTAVAVSLGAPFWFDVLNKVMIVRSTVKPFEKSPSAGSEDRSGAVPPGERLEPGAGGTAAAAPGARPGGPLAPPVLVNVRLAIDLDGVASETLELSVNQVRRPIPGTGLLELQLEAGTVHAFAATASFKGGRGRWAQSVAVTPDDEGLALRAAFVAA